MSADVVIAGGGIGGTVLASLLVRAGKRVVIIERAAGPPPFLRPEILWPPAVAALCGLRPREFWERECLRALGGIAFIRAGRPLHLMTRAILDRAGVQPFLENPNTTRETLLSICGAEVRRGVEVLGLLRDGARVRGVRARELATGAGFDVEAPLTVGDDGPESRVRAGCGIELRLRPFPVEFVVRALPWPAQWPADIVRVFTAGRRLRGGLFAFGMMPMPGGLAAALGAVRAGSGDDGLAEDFAQMLAVSGDVPGELRDCGFPAGFTRIKRAWGHAPRYGCEGAVLLGDALHPVSPAGGQGANMAVADAVALARLILAGTPDLAAAFERARRRFNERGISPTRLTERAFGLGTVPLMSRLGGALMRLLLRWEWPRIRAFRTLAGRAADLQKS